MKHTRLVRQLARRRSPRGIEEPLYGRVAVVTASGGSGVTVNIDGVDVGPLAHDGSTFTAGDTVFLIRKGRNYYVLPIRPL